MSFVTFSGWWFTWAILQATKNVEAVKFPVAFVPPTLLRQRLADIEKRLPLNMRFVIPLEEVGRLYKLAVSDCIFDSTGGLAKVGIPLVETSHQYEMYQFTPLHFAYEGQTYAIKSPSTYIMKELNENRMFTVTEIDLEECEPKKNGLCRVPLVMQHYTFLLVF